MKKKDIIKLSILGLLVGGGTLTYFLSGLNKVTPDEFRLWIAGFGIFSGLVFILLYSIGPVFLIPGSLLSISAGVIFGPAKGTAYVIVGASIGATLAFLSARYFGSSIQHKLEHTKIIGELDKRIEKRGFITVLLLRLIPIFPYNILNYGLGLTDVRKRAYISATVLGMIPGIFAYVYLGNSLLSPSVKGISYAVVILGGFILLPSIFKKHVKRHISR